MRLVLFEPDIPQNTAALIRLAACLGVAIDVVEPCGFLWDDRRMRRVGMDYLAKATVVRHPSWSDFQKQAQNRLLLLTTNGTTAYAGFSFRCDDSLVVGRESAGVPEFVHDAVDARLRIPLQPGLRSLNVALAAAMVLGEALRQTQGFPETKA